MANASSELPIVLYHYHYSPFAKRLVWYLNLRGIPYVQCLQPPILPRPDLARLGIKYRRIPILTIGRDVYLDTRLIIQKLEPIRSASQPRLSAASSFSCSSSSSSSSAAAQEHLALERLLEALVVDGGIFMRAAQLLPLNLPLLRDPKFQADRADFRADARRPSRGETLALQAEAANEIAAVLALLETTLLADGRDWILATPAPSLADIEAVWPFHWLVGLPGALDSQVVSAERLPRVFAWIDRFDRAVKAAERANGEVKTRKRLTCRIPS
ncbi:hypothetical protein P8C59_004197 [Phyllachora maydis]|uniref:Glutathione S-transferase n=1 Tax=Phyllachora maydis TaxID=1825666 RepID=A0AAD9I2Y5_9PEZI|nr:hypothetical protein P8C59_004197 [Phyllachora maydis]